jgi:ribonuclease BN (tRNA processing enzyme)
MTTIDALSVTTIGVGAAYGRAGEAQACHLVRTSGRTICLDLGAGALNALSAHVAPEDLDLIVISHLHPDHLIDLLALRVYMVWGPGAGRQLRIVGPPGLADVIAGFGADGIGTALVFEELRGDAPASDLDGDLTIRHRRVPHLDPTYATRIDAGGRSVCFGADCAPNDALAELADATDILITECSFGTAPVPAGAMHLNAGMAGAIAAAAGARRLVLTHCFPEWDPHVAADAAAAASGVPAVAATGGAVFAA